MNQVFEHSVITVMNSLEDEQLQPPSRIRWTSVFPRSSIFSHFPLGVSRSIFTPTYLHVHILPSGCAAQAKPSRSHFTLITHQSTSEIAMSTTESLHKQCRTLESLFDNKLTAYSRLAATITRPGSHDLESTGSLERWQDLEVELEELLQKVCITSVCAIWYLTLLLWLQLGEINDELDTLSNDANSQATQTMLRAIQRHRDVHQDNIREFRRTKAR